MTHRRHLIQKLVAIYLLQGDAGYQDVLDCATSLAEVDAVVKCKKCCESNLFLLHLLMIFLLLQMLHLRQEEILVESTGVIGHRIKKVGEKRKPLELFVCL